MTHLLRNLAVGVAVLVLALWSFQGHARSTVVVNGTRFTCQNACVVTYTSSGKAQVSDSKGGWVQIITSGTPVDVLD
jgi:hypothetical protein